MNAIVAYDPDWAIEQIANGAFLKDLSAQTGVDKRRLSEQLRKHPDYTAAKEASIEIQLDDAQNAIESAREATDIARARERFRAAAWRAEREFPHRWGAKQEITHELGQSFEALLSEISSRRTANAAQHDRVIDVTPDYVKSGSV